jgi:hypothetical protein
VFTTNGFCFLLSLQSSFAFVLNYPQDALRSFGHARVRVRREPDEHVFGARLVQEMGDVISVLVRGLAVHVWQKESVSARNMTKNARARRGTGLT